MSETNKRYRLVKFIKDQKLNIVFEERNSKGGWDKTDKTKGDEPMPDFRSAMDALKTDFVALCELPKDDVKVVRIDSIHLSYHGDNEDQLGVVISGIKRMNKSSGAMSMSTPLRLARLEKPNTKKDISDTLQAKLDGIVEQAALFLSGKVQQTKADLK